MFTAILAHNYLLGAMMSASCDSCRQCSECSQTSTAASMHKVQCCIKTRTLLYDHILYAHFRTARGCSLLNIHTVTSPSPPKLDHFRILFCILYFVVDSQKGILQIAGDTIGKVPSKTTPVCSTFL